MQLEWLYFLVCKVGASIHYEGGDDDLCSSVSSWLLKELLSVDEVDSVLADSRGGAGRESDDEEESEQKDELLSVVLALSSFSENVGGLLGVSIISSGGVGRKI